MYALTLSELNELQQLLSDKYEEQGWNHRQIWKKLRRNREVYFSSTHIVF